MDDTQAQVAMRTLASRYCSFVDDGDAAGMAGLFVPGGKLVVYPAGAKPGQDVDPLRVWEGPEAFARLIATLQQSYLRWVHFLGTHWVDVDGDTATGEACLLAHHLRSGESAEEEEVAIIRYRDSYRLTGGGWRFVTRRAYRQWTTMRPVGGGVHRIDAVLRG